MTDLADVLGYKESDLPWTFHVVENVGELEIRFNAETLPSAIRRPIMVCKLQFTHHNDQEPQVVFLEKNTLFQPSVMTAVLNFLAADPIEIL